MKTLGSLAAIVSLWLATTPRAPAQEGFAVLASGGKVYRVQLGNQPQELYNGSVAHASWSVDGRYIYFIKTNGEIWRMDNDGGQQRKIASGRNTEYAPLSAYRPDPESVLYVEGTKFYRIPSATGERQEIQPVAKGIVGEIGIDAAGKRLSGRDSSSNLQAIEVGGSARQYSSACSASVSVSGKYLTANVDGHRQMTIHSWDGTKWKTLDAPTGKQWDNQRFSVNSDDYVVFNYDQDKAIGLVHVPTNKIQKICDLWSVYPDFFLGSLPDPASPAPGPQEIRIVALSATPNPAAVGTPVKFLCVATSGSDPSLSFDWSFGDASSSTLTEPSHVYLAVGTYRVRVTVRDGAGNRAERELSVSVVEPSANGDISTPDISGEVPQSNPSPPAVAAGGNESVNGPLADRGGCSSASAPVAPGLAGLPMLLLWRRRARRICLSAGTAVSLCRIASTSRRELGEPPPRVRER